MAATIVEPDQFECGDGVKKKLSTLDALEQYAPMDIETEAEKIERLQTTSQR